MNSYLVVRILDEKSIFLPSTFVYGDVELRSVARAGAAGGDGALLVGAYGGVSDDTAVRRRQQHRSVSTVDDQ